MTKIENVHDKFFKKVFSDRKNVRLLLQKYLPETIIRHIDFRKVSIDSSNYISESMSEYFSDLVVKTGLKHSSKSDDQSDVDIYVLIEHKSYPDAGVFVQLLHYMAQMWERDVSEGKLLRIIFPFVFYHGSRKWSLPEEFIENFSVPVDLQPHMLNFACTFFTAKNWSLEREAIAEIKQNIHYVTALQLLKSAFEKNLAGIQKIFDLWAEVGLIDTGRGIEENGVILYLTYITETKDIQLDKLGDMLEESKIKGDSIMPTLAQRLRQEGRQEGKREGRQEGRQVEKRDILISLLEKKFGLTQIERKRIENYTDSVKLGKAIEALVFSDTKSDVLDKLG